MRAVKFTEKEIETILCALRDEQRDSGFRPAWVRISQRKKGQIELEYAPMPIDKALETHFPEYLP